MRRLLAFILSALMVLSCCGALFAAADPEPEEPDFYVELSVDGPYFYGEPFTVHAVVKDIKPGVELTSVEFNLCFDENYLTFSGSIYDIVTARPSSAWENLSSTRWDCICVNVSNTDNDTDVATADGDIAFDFEFTCWSEYNYDLAIYVEDAVASDVDFEYHYGEGNRIDLERGGRIKAEDIESVEIIRRDEKIYEGELYKKGLYASYDDDGKPVVWHGDYYDYYDNGIKVTLKDGTTYSSDYFSGGMCVAAYEDGTWYNNGYRIRGEIYELKYTDDQKKDGPWTAGVHTVHCDFEGFEFDYDVEILESPVVSLTVYPLDIIEGYGRNNTSMYDYDIADWANVNAYEYYADSLKWEAVLNDGTVLNQSASYYNGEDVRPFVTDDQVHEEWTLGNTYAATANVLGCSTGFEVTIIDTPIDHIDIPALRIVEGTHGYADSGWNSDDDYVEYYYYCDFGLKNATVYFKDGSTAELNGSSIYYNGDWYYGDFTVVSDQDADHIWTVGNTYKVSFAVLNYTAEFDVEIIASPFVSATVEPITIMPETGGNWDYVYDDYGNREDYYYYNLDFDVTVELSDGSSITGVNSVEYDGRWYYLDNIDIAGSQYKNHLLPGNTYTGTGTICGLETQISLTIAESPIESIEFEELKIPVHSNGWYTTDDYGEEYYYYDYGYPEYTVYFKDGSDLTVCGDGFEYDGVWYDIMRFEDFQYFTHWEEGWSYEVEIGVGGYRGKFEVEITECPIDSVYVSDVCVIQYTDGYFDTDSEGAEYFCYYFEPEFNVYFKDGNELCTEDPWFEYEGNYYNIDYYFDQNETHMVPGHSYMVNGSVADVKFSFFVMVVTPSFTKVTIDDVYVMEDDSLTYFPAVTLEYEDGSVVQRTTGSFSRYTGSSKYDAVADFTASEGILEDVSFKLYIADGQDRSNPLPAGDYEIPAMLAGVDCSFTLHVVDTPVESISVDPLTAIEHARGRWSTRINPDTSQKEPYFEYYLSTFPVHVVFKDGTEEDITSVYKYCGKEYSVTYGYTSQYTEPWVLGGTYNIHVEFMGVTAATTVTVIETPVESVVIDTISLVENGSGYWSTRWDETEGKEVEFFRYSFPNVRAAVTFKDGTVAEVGEYSYLYTDGSWYSLTYNFPDQDEEPWVIGGEYECTASFMGKDTTFTIKIIKTPVEKISVEAVSVLANTNGYWDTRWDDKTGKLVEFYYYRFDDVAVTATFIDGTVDSFRNRYYYGDKYYYVNFDAASQYEEPWLPGNTYYVTAEFMGVETQYAFTVLETPIESIAVEPVSIIENGYGYWDTRWNDAGKEEDFFYYELPGVKATVTFKDGTIAEYDGGLYYDDVYYSFDFSGNGQYDEPWVLGGTYNAKCTLLGYACDVPVTIIETPVESVKVFDVSVEESEAGTRYYWDGDTQIPYPYYYTWSYRPDRILVTLKDGSVVELNSYDSFEYLGVYYNWSVSSTQSYEMQWNPGYSYVATLSIAGVNVPFFVKVLEKPVYGEADGYTYMLQNNEITVIDCLLDDAVITVPERLDGYMVTAVASLGYGSETEKIIIPDHILRVGEDAFLGRYNVTEIEIGANVEWLHVSMFGPLPKLQNITVLYNDYYKSVDGILYNAAGDTLVAYPLGQGNLYVVPANVSNIDVLSWYFYENVSIIFAEGNDNFVQVDGVTYNGDMTAILFVDANKTGEYVMPDTVTEINEGAFRENTGLTRIVFSQGVTELVYMEFMGCTALESVELPEKLTAIQGGAFYGCTSLKSVKLPYAQFVGYGVFAYCTSLTEAEIAAEYDYIPDGLFLGCSSLEHFEIADNITFIEPDAFRGTAIASIELPDGLIGIESGAFANTPLASVDLPEGLESIGSGAFRNTALTELTIPDSVRWLGSGVLEDCRLLQSCTFNKATDIIPMRFFAGSGIVSYTVPEHIVFIDDEAFSYCRQLSEIKFANPYTGIGWSVFEGCSLKDSTYPQINYVSMYCFADSDLRTFRVPATVTEIAYGAFRWCTDLAEVTIPASVKTISGSAFMGTGLRSVRYVGTADEWEDIEIYENNEPLLNAARIYIAQLESEGVTGEILRSEYDDAVKLVAEKIDKTGYEVEGMVVSEVYNIYFTRNGERFEPSEGMALLLPLPEGVDASGAAAAAFDGDKKATEIEAIVSGGMIQVKATGILAVGYRRITYNNDDGIEIAADSAFEDGTVIRAERITRGAEFNRIVAALPEGTDFVAFDITATVDGVQVQPNGKVTVTLDIPASLGSNVEFYYLSAEGVLTKVPCSIDLTNRKLTAELDHFSTYVMAEVREVSATYTVRFLDWDGTVISEQKYASGARITVPADPERPDDDSNTYTFAGWDKQVSATANADATYTATYTASPKSLGYIPGDVNGNGKIDTADYAMCKRAYLRTFTLNEEQLKRADINKNGKVDASEYAMIKRHYLGTYVIPGAEGK